MNPATLSIITATFPPRQRGTAIGIWAGVSAMALAIGPLVGGLLTEHVNWNWIFFINVPIGIAGLLAIPLFIDESRDTSHEQRPDVPGLVTLGGRPLRAHLRVHRGEQLRLDVARGSSARSPSRRSRSSRSCCSSATSALPMLDLSLFRNRTFSGANTAMLFVGLAMFGTFFYVSLYMQNVLGYSPVAGRRVVPADDAADHPDRAAAAGKLSDRFGSRWLVGGGMTLLAIMLFYYSQLGAHESFWALLPGLLIGGVGMALTMTPTTAAAMSAVPVDKAGVGSAVLNSCASGRRLARDRGDGRDRRVGARRAERRRHAASRVPARLPRRAARRRAARASRARSSRSRRSARSSISSSRSTCRRAVEVA